MHPSLCPSKGIQLLSSFICEKCLTPEVWLLHPIFYPINTQLPVARRESFMLSLKWALIILISLRESLDGALWKIFTLSSLSQTKLISLDSLFNAPLLKGWQRFRSTLVVSILPFYFESSFSHCLSPSMNSALIYSDSSL